MARWASQCELGPVSFSGCRVELVDGGGFLTNYIGSVDFGNDGTPDIQTINRNVKGVTFGLRMVSAEATKIDTLRSAINTAQGTQGTIRAQVTDGIFTLDIDVVPDPAQEWFVADRHSEGWYENVVLRFISVRAHV